MLVTTLDAGGLPARDRDGHVNTYVIGPARFEALYRVTGEPAPQPEYGALFEARGEVEAFAAPGGFEIMAPWGEMERAETGYLVLNGVDVYVKDPQCHGASSSFSNRELSRLVEISPFERASSPKTRAESRASPPTHPPALFPPP